MREYSGEVYEEGYNSIEHELHHLNGSFEDLDPQLIIRVYPNDWNPMVAFLSSCLAFLIGHLIVFKATIEAVLRRTICPLTARFTSPQVFAQTKLFLPITIRSPGWPVQIVLLSSR